MAPLNFTRLGEHEQVHVPGFPSEAFSDRIRNLFPADCRPLGGVLGEPGREGFSRRTRPLESGPLVYFQEMLHRHLFAGGNGVGHINNDVERNDRS